MPVLGASNLITGVASGLFVVTDPAYGAKGDGTTDDTAAIQAAITDAQAVHGSVYLPRGLYKTTSALQVSAPCRIVGESCLPIYGSVTTAFDTINLPVTAPYLAGAVLMPSTAGQNGITITGAGNRVDLRDLGIRFADAIRFTNTGHGIYYSPPAVAGGTGYLDNGLMDAHWDNVVVFGHDGNHYAFYLVNTLYSSLKHCRGFGGGTLWLENNGSTGSDGVTAAQNYGNIHVDHLYGQVLAGGSAHGIRLVQTAGQLNLLVFTRPQVTVGQPPATFTGVAAPTSAQSMLKSDDAVSRVAFIAPDFETNVNSTAHYPASSWTTAVTPGGFIGDDTLVGGVWYYDAASQHVLTRAAEQSAPPNSGSYRINFVTGNNQPLQIGTDSNRVLQLPGAMQNAGYATASRPSASTVGAGAQVFDTTLNKPIWSTGSGWVDATGVTV